MAAVYSQSHVLAAESVHQRIAAVVQEYLALIEAAADRSVEVYTVNTFFATDAISAHIFGRGISLRCLEGCKDDQGIVLRHYADDARARVFLRAEMPAVARVLEWVQGKGGEDPLEAWAWAAWKRWEVDPEAGVVVDLLNGRKGWTEADVGSEITVGFPCPSQALLTNSGRAPRRARHHL